MSLLLLVLHCAKRLISLFNACRFVIWVYWIYLRIKYTKTQMVIKILKPFLKLVFWPLPKSLFTILFFILKLIAGFLWIERGNVIAITFGSTTLFVGWFAWSHSHSLALLQTAWARWPDLTTAEALEKLHQELDANKILHSYFRY
ncbi:hypothetical protein BKA61DRAFT_621671 [Leptodontidium sp. MPI-SDFR-AT-0119]|nr:hypothetical protein BKA61DRAFT_621671 [Leptodontidium sp. MPI-SDFR-AT-0119]